MSDTGERGKYTNLNNRKLKEERSHGYKLASKGTMLKTSIGRNYS